MDDRRTQLIWDGVVLNSTPSIALYEEPGIALATLGIGLKESTSEGRWTENFKRSWQPEGKTRGVLIIVPRFNSHSGQYLWAGEQFAAKDLAAYAIDLRGRARSEGERYYVEKMADYTEDVATLFRTAKSEIPVCRCSFLVTVRAVLFRAFMRSTINQRSMG